MTSRVERFTFQMDIPVFAVRPFTSEGQQFNKGDDYPWDEMGVTPEKAEKLFQVGYIRHKVGAVSQAKPQPKATVKTTTKRTKPATSAKTAPKVAAKAAPKRKTIGGIKRRAAT